MPFDNISDGALLTPKEVAYLLRLSVKTLERFRSEGGGPPFIKLGNGKRARVVYPALDLRIWLANRWRRSTSDDDPGPDDPNKPDGDK
jgi:Helix-turn-helix domain